MEEHINGRILIINNAGFLRDKCGEYYISNSTGQFIAEISDKVNDQIEMFQLVSDGRIGLGINNYKINGNINLYYVKYNTGLRKLLSYLISMPKIISIIKRYKLVYIFYPGNISLVVALICVLFNCPYGLYVRGEYRKRFSKFILKRAKFINTVGPVFKETIEQINTNCGIIKPMVQFDFSKNPVNNNRIRKKEILFVGRLEQAKGIWELVDAAEYLQRINKDYKFRLIGAGKDQLLLEKYLEQKGIYNVILSGPIYESEVLKDYYLQAEIFLFPSYNEGFPRVLYEAMYFGLPIITTFVGNVPGIMKDNYNCLEIAPKDSESIILKLNKIIGNESLMKILAGNGLQTVVSIFSEHNKSHSEMLLENIDK